MFLKPIAQLIKQLNGMIVIFTLVVLSLLIKLGLWQTERAIEKELRIERISQLSQGQVLSLSDVLSLQNEPDGINDLLVKIEGEFLPQHVFLLDNQPNKGKLGYRVYQIIKTNQQALLVNLGWVQGNIDRNKLPEITPLSGQYSFQGHVREVELGIQLQAQDFSHATWPLRVQQIEIEKFSILLSIKLLPFVVYLDENETLGYQKNWQPIVMPPEKHRAYAFQWFSLAIAWLVLMVWAGIKMSKPVSIKKEQSE